MDSSDVDVIMFVGDLHGNLMRALDLIDIARRRNIKEIIQVGDWGFIWGKSEAYKSLSMALVDFGIQMRFCDGNHDVHPVLRQLEKDKDGNVAPNLTYQFRGSMKEIYGQKIVFLGGAPSIDRRWRVVGESWWPEEYITDAEAEAAQKWGKADILVTHDSPEKPEGFKVTSDMGFNYRADDSNKKIRDTMIALRPTYLIHGHYHYNYTSVMEGTNIIGLDCDDAPISLNYKNISFRKKEENGSEERETEKP